MIKELSYQEESNNPPAKHDLRAGCGRVWDPGWGGWGG